MKKLLALVDELRDCDHAFLNEKGIEHFTKPFGFLGSAYRARDNRSEFKGLNLGEGFKEGDVALGQDASRTAKEICEHLGIKFSEMFGRGSQLRVCCDKLEEHIRATN